MMAALLILGVICAFGTISAIIIAESYRHSSIGRTADKMVPPLALACFSVACAFLVALIWANT